MWHHADNPTGTALTGDPPSAAPRRPGTGPHARPAPPLGRHGRRRLRRRRPDRPPPARTGHRAARGPGRARRPRSREGVPPRAPAAAPGTEGADFPLDCGPADAVVQDEAEGDLDGDRAPETVAVVHCDAAREPRRAPSTSSPPTRTRRRRPASSPPSSTRSNSGA
ncbi:hypothetical protein ACFQVA_06090 [Actinomadura keratinilytica]